MWTILIAVCLVFVVCGPIWAIARYLRVQLPKFLLPMIAGITLFSFNIYMSYSWFDRMVASYDDDIIVQQEYRTSSIFAPWTFLVPRVSHFVAINAKKEPYQIPETDVVEGALVMIQEYADPMNLTVYADCANEQVGMLPTNQVPTDKNPLDVVQWTAKKEFPYLIEYYCSK
ncbi:MAG: hypothetical protein HWE30_09620 [Methylocystaceae bacterium]|nr:hypothetical protein [Methylocystaceae bacterium]